MKPSEKYSAPGLKIGRVKPILEDFSREELVEMIIGGNIAARNLVMMTKLLIEALGKETAGKLISEARRAPIYEQARALAERLGNPQDLDSLVEQFRIKSPPWVPLVTIHNRTENKVVIRQELYCWEATAIKKLADKEIQRFLAEHWCVHDRAWVNGFNPKVGFEHTKHYLRGDDCCEFVLTLPGK